MMCRRELRLAGFFVRLCIRTKNKGLPGPFFVRVHFWLAFGTACMRVYMWLLPAKTA
jgi:hypothetical protein